MPLGSFSEKLHSLGVGATSLTFSPHISVTSRSVCYGFQITCTMYDCPRSDSIHLTVTASERNQTSVLLSRTSKRSVQVGLRGQGPRNPLLRGSLFRLFPPEQENVPGVVYLYLNVLFSPARVLSLCVFSSKAYFECNNDHITNPDRQFFTEWIVNIWNLGP